MINDCWNVIGVQGDGSCPELKTLAHCHNCPVHARAAVELLTLMPVSDVGAAHSSQVARAASESDHGVEATLVFRIGREWLGLSVAAVTEITRPARVHSVPHRPSRFARGIVNVRGELLLFASLDVLLGIESATADPSNPAGSQRMLVMRHGDVRAASVVDEVRGVLRFPPRVRREVPLTLARASVSHVKHLVTWEGRSVGLLDSQALFERLQRSAA